jgi:hypothetical protein
MMPLCTRATRPPLPSAPSTPSAPSSAFGPGLKCGCALRTAGTPCVAQRVWAMPVPEAMPSSAAWVCNSATRLVERARRSCPPWCTATPQLS